MKVVRTLLERDDAEQVMREVNILRREEMPRPVRRQSRVVIQSF
jgi:hypothetical protein